LQLAAVLAVAGGLKLFYSSASVNDLRWVLAPTAWLVELVTRERFTFEAHAGYMIGDRSFLIAAPCSGVNFLIAAFLMLTLRRLWRGWWEPVNLLLVPASLAVAYLTTIVANTVRIVGALQLHRMDEDLVWVNPDQAHRLEGIFVYFGCLLLLFVFSERLDEDDSPSRPRHFFDLRRIALPLVIYWVTTLGIPLANGAYHQGVVFWEHAAFVFLTPLALMLPLAVINGLRIRYRT
jgi:exosortase K